MHAQPLAAIVLTCSCTAALAQQTITLTSPSDTFRVNTTAIASVSKSGPYLDVKTEKHTVQASRKFEKPNYVVGYTAALATTNAQGQWEIQRRSAEVEMPMTLDPGETKNIPSNTLAIPIDGIDALEKHWIVLEVKLRDDKALNGYEFIYAHSAKLKPIP